MTFISRWSLMKLCLKAQRCAVCCHGSGYLWPRLRAHSRCQVERGDGESRRPLAVLAIGSEKRRNVGQLCHPFEVGTACLWSGGRVPGFHVLLSCDLGRPRLHKPYWLYRLKKKWKKWKKHWHNLFQPLWDSEAWSFMKWDEWESTGNFKASPRHDLQTDKHWTVLKNWLITWGINKRFKRVMWHLISGRIIIQTLTFVHNSFNGIVRLHQRSLCDLVSDCVIKHELKVKPWNCKSSHHLL